MDHTAWAEAGMKHYSAAVLRNHSPVGPVLDLGCGAGPDLALLHASGSTAVGVDLSAVMLGAARERLGSEVPLVRADGAALPFRDGSFEGCRMERVLMHVEFPDLVVGEAVRCVRPGGLITMFEPDWSSLLVRTDDDDQPGGWLSGARHPAIGGALWGLAEGAGCAVLDRVEELSVWRTLEPLEMLPGGVRQVVERAVQAGRIDRREADRWLKEQTGRADRGSFLATIRKTLVVAERATE